MAEKNLSEELFKPRFKHPETSSLVRRQQCAHHAGSARAKNDQIHPHDQIAIPTA